jgi:fido (protein-threonine AMPylation protein)
MALMVAGKDRAESRRLQRMAEEGHLRRLYSGIYTDDLDSPIEADTRRHLNELCGLIMPGCIVSHRSAMEQRPTTGGQYFVTGPYRRDLELPGVKVRAIKGPGPLPSDVRIPHRHGDVYVSGQARCLLENLQPSRGELAERRTLGVEFVERWLDRFITNHSTTEVTRLRTVAREIAESIGLTEEWRKLDGLIGALLGTRRGNLVTPAAIARAARLPYDSERLELFESLARELQKNPVFVPAVDAQVDAQLQAFIETYFSNFIEGTEFDINVALDIVVNGRPLKYREDDSHDILGTYRAILRSKHEPALPESAETFVQRLREWNRQVIESRLDKTPGEFKTETNRAGQTVFVQPELVTGTLIKGYEYIMSATTPANRAALAMFVVAEVHPFNDGNGRTARIAMNHFLTNANLTRIIIPTIYRDDYVTSLKAMTNGHPTPLSRMLSYAARFSRWLDMSAKDRCFAALDRSNALKEDHKQFRLTFDDSHVYETE